MQHLRNLLFLNAGQHSQLSFWMLFIIGYGGVLYFVRASSLLLGSIEISGLSPISERFEFYYLVPVVLEFFNVFFSSLFDPQPKQVCRGYFITVGAYLLFCSQD